MAQQYQASTAPLAAVNESTEAVQERIENGLNIEQVQEAYREMQTRLVGALDSTKEILGDIKEFNNSSWIVRYPTLSEASSASQSPAGAHSTASPVTGRPMKRSLSFADDPTSSHDVVMRPGLQRSVTLATVGEEVEAASTVSSETLVDASNEERDANLLPPESDFHVLRLDLKLGPTGASPAFLVNQLEKASIANLVEGRINHAMGHIDKLKTRVEDTSSKVLVTGDLNAGKSTFVNALLKREVLPVDQQPCTAMFCEVHDAADNDGKEEIHLEKEGVAYNRENEATFTRAAISELEDIAADPDNAQRVLKLYVNDSRSPSESLLHNGIADIALIDAPGLNRDSLKTTALFARQEEIDVVVFVVSAENHFTLSAKEFLWNASNEKAYIFIVVNRFDQIRDKARCKRVVLEQIKQLSPRTYEDADDLVHFVDSNSALHTSAVDGSFSKLESDLRSFVLVKRSKSKLSPATNYLGRILSDISLLSSSNVILADSERDAAREVLERTRPVLEGMKANRSNLEDGLENVEDDGAAKAHSRTRERLNEGLDRVGRGELATDDAVALPPYPGLLGVIDWTKEVKQALLASLDLSVKLAEDEARIVTSNGVNRISTMAEQYLPSDVERSRRVFVPSAMFSPKQAKKSKRNSGIMVVGGIHGLGLGLAQRPEMLEVTFSDILDIQHRLAVHLKHSDDSGLDSNDAAAGALSLASLGLGALTLASGKAVGLRGAFEGLVRITDLFGNETARKWAVPVLGVFTVGLTAYFVLELPNSIPKNVGRRLKASLIHPVDPESGEPVEEDLKFVNAHCTRIGRETRKVLRLASWDLRERFRGAMAEREKEVKHQEEREAQAINASNFFGGVVERSEEIGQLVHQS